MNDPSDDTAARAPERRPSRFLLALLPPALAFLVQLAVREHVEPSVWFLFYPAVFLSSWIGGLRAGVVSSALSTLAVLWFFLPPRHAFPEEPGHYFVGAVFFATGVVFGAFHDRLRRANDRLHESRERLARAVRGADLGTWDWNIETGEVVYDARWAEMRGFRLDEIGRDVATWRSGVHPDDWPLVQQRLDDHLAGRTPEYEVEARVRTKSGDWIWVLARGKVFARDERGHAMRMVGTERDITARKRAEQELRRAEARSWGILSVSADAIITIDADQRITLFNEGAEKLFGRSREEMIGAPLDVLIPERFRAMHRQHVRAFAEGPDVARRMHGRRIDIRAMRSNGEEFPADAAISKLDVGGETILAVSLRDITEQRRHEREQSFLAEVGAALSATLDYDETLTNIAALAAREIADFCVVDVLDENERDVSRRKAVCRDAAHDAVCEQLAALELDRSRPHLTHAALDSRQPVLVEHVSPDALRALTQSEEHLRVLQALDARSMMALPLVAHGRLLGAIALVSSSESRAYGPGDLRFGEELAVRAALAIDNARLYRTATRAIQTRDDVLGIVAHDLRSPLGAVMLHATFLKRPGAQPDRRSHRPADGIARAAGRMGRLIDDLLDVTRAEAGELSVDRARVPTVPVISESLDAQATVAKSASIELHRDLPPELPDVWADRDRLLQILENLIGNAIKFSGTGGHVTVGGAARDGEVVFWVADTGPGIPSEDLPHVFDRFWQAARARRAGAGLGLAIVEGLVEAHRGRVWVESTVGRGTTFYFTIPTAPRAERRPPEPAPALLR